MSELADTFEKTSQNICAHICAYFFIHILRLNFFILIKKLAFFSGLGVEPPPPVADASVKNAIIFDVQTN